MTVTLDAAAPNAASASNERRSRVGRSACACVPTGVMTTSVPRTPGRLSTPAGVGVGFASPTRRPYTSSGCPPAHPVARRLSSVGRAIHS